MTEEVWDADVERINIARDLREISALYAALPNEAAHHADDPDIPGGDALHLAGPAANLEAWQHRYEKAEEANEADYAIDQVDTELHPLLVLASWEDQLRDARNQPTDLRATVKRATAYINGSLDWAFDPNHHDGGSWPPITQLATDLARVARHLETVTMDGTRHTWSEVECLVCGEALCRRMLKSGIEDHHWCHGCHRNLAPHEFYLAAAQTAQLAFIVDSED